MKIMVFLHGTAIMHRGALGRTREERVQQVRDGEASIHDYASYMPVGQAAAKLRAWRDQGAEIVYLSSRRQADAIEQDRLVLQAYDFPAGPIYFRRDDERYCDVAERVMPDVLIEDDCESIGGERQMTYPHLGPEARARVQSIVVREFGGLDHLPDDLAALRGYPARPKESAP